MNTTASPLESSLAWSSDWRSSTGLAGFFLLVLGVLYWPTYTGIFSVWWNNETFAHGFLIPLIIAYLLWQQRADLVELSPQPAPMAALVILFLSLFWLLGYVADIAVVQQFSVVAMLPVMAWLIFGTAVVKVIFFPLAYFIFAVPLGEFLVPTLQDFTATFVVKALQMTGVPVLWEGLFFYLPTGSFEVAKACSGVRYLIASLALGTLYAYLTYRSWSRRLLFIGIAIVVPIVANGIRAYGIVMMAYLSDYKLAAGVDHILYGWLFFGIVMLLMFWIGSLFKDPPLEGADEVIQNSATLSSNDSVTVSQNYRFLISGGWVLLALLFAASAPGLSTWLDTRADIAPAPQIILPTGDDWSGPHSLLTASYWHPQFPGAIERRGSYNWSGQTVDVYIAYFHQQQQGGELINVMNAVYDHEQARLLQNDDSTVMLENGQTWRVHETQINPDTGNNRLIWQWYEVAGEATTNRVSAKLLEIRRRLLTPQQGSAAIVISSVYDLGPDEARKRLQKFLREMLPSLRAAVNQ